MANVKDEGKKMDPMFPRLHLSDADEGGPRTPPRNKMAISQTTQKFVSGSVSPILPLSTNKSGSLAPPRSSYHDTSYKRSVFSSFGRSHGSTRMATRLDSYHSSDINLNISLTTVKQNIETTNCQTLCNKGQLKHGFKPQDLKSTRTTLIKKLEDEDDYLLPSLSFGNREHNIKHLTACQKQLKLTDKDTIQENKLDTTTVKDISKEPVSCFSDRVLFSEMLSKELSPPNPRKRSILMDEPHMLHDPNIRLPFKKKSFQESMDYKDGKRNVSTSIWPVLEDNGKSDSGTHEILASINKSEEDHRSLHLEEAGKIGELLEANIISDYNNRTPGEASHMIGLEQYRSARRILIRQQRVFQSQLFELHRLIKVQKLLAESPNLLLNDTFHKQKKSPSEDIFPHIDHHKEETYLTFPIDTTMKKPLHTNHTEYIYNPNLLDLPPPPTINSPKQPPWCFLPPPGNQWLVPVRSPSEGLVYKPYTGPTPPPVGLMTPIYSMTIPPSNNDFLTNTYNINPTSYNQQGISMFPNTPLFTSYGLPTIDDTFKCNIPVKPTCKENDLQLSKDELPLFPTTPMVDQDPDQCTKEKIKVIKVLPRNPNLASESTARIFQFIQEERKIKE